MTAGSIAPVIDRSRLADPVLLPIADKVERGERLSSADGVALFRTPDLLGLASSPMRAIGRCTATG
jgi:hypothetical protein